MKNMDLNIGGLFGAILFSGAIIGAVIYLADDPEEVPGRIAKLVIFGVVGGAVTGNFLWGLVFPKKPGRDSSDPEDSE